MSPELVGVSIGVSESGKVASVAPMVMGYPYHCVCARMGVGRCAIVGATICVPSMFRSTKFRLCSGG